MRALTPGRDQRISARPGTHITGGSCSSSYALDPANCPKEARPTSVARPTAPHLATTEFYSLCTPVRPPSSPPSRSQHAELALSLPFVTEARAPTPVTVAVSPTHEPPVEVVDLLSEAELPLIIATRTVCSKRPHADCEVHLPPAKRTPISPPAESHTLEDLSCTPNVEPPSPPPRQCAANPPKDVPANIPTLQVPQTGGWTEEEDERLISGILQIGRGSAVKLAKLVLTRTAAQIKARWNTVAFTQKLAAANPVSAPAPRSGPWAEEELQRLIDAIVALGWEAPRGALATRVGTRSRQQVFDKLKEPAFLRRLPNKPTPEESGFMTGQWSRPELDQLLSGLNTSDGSDNIASISEFVPTRTLAQVKAQMQHLSAKGRLIRDSSGLFALTEPDL